MSWHDCRLHAVGMVEEPPHELPPTRLELLFDLDYIFDRVLPFPEADYFLFWAAPVTLVFENAVGLKVDVSSQGPWWEIFDVQRAAEHPTPAGNFREWKIEITHGGEITFEATGFKQYVRRRPILSRDCCFLNEARGGISFNRGPDEIST
jgi:hypothetical protein